MIAPEFSRLVDERQVTAKPLQLEATAEERAALTKRFGLIAIDRLEANVAIERHGEALAARGKLCAAIVQSCAVSGEDLPVTIEEPLAMRFVPTAPEPSDEEIELAESDLDEIPFEGHVFDLGEAVAQSLALAIDPYATGPEAERVRKEKGLNDEAARGPFSVLKGLKTGN